LPDLAVLVEPLLVVRRVLRQQLGILHRRLLVIVRDDEVCRRLMTVPGVGPVVALTYRATVDVPARFRRSKAVGAVFGLTGPDHADPNQQMVLAQGLGDADRQASWDEEGDRGAGAPAGRDHAPHMGGRHRVLLDPGSRSSMRTIQDQLR
jgi:transposase IS116/IS110/IS902 family protein